MTIKSVHIGPMNVTQRRQFASKLYLRRSCYTVPVWLRPESWQLHPWCHEILTRWDDPGHWPMSSQVLSLPTIVHVDLMSSWLCSPSKCLCCTPSSMLLQCGVAVCNSPSWRGPVVGSLLLAAFMWHRDWCSCGGVTAAGASLTASLLGVNIRNGLV